MNEKDSMHAGLDPESEVDLDTLLAEATTEADPEQLLKELQGVQGLKTYWSSGKGKEGYEELRDQLVKVVEAHGVVYFIGRDGAKWYAVVSRSDLTEVDEELLLQLLTERDDCSEELLDEVMPRKLSVEGLKRANASERMPRDVFARVTRLKKRAPHIDFHRAEDPE